MTEATAPDRPAHTPGPWKRQTRKGTTRFRIVDANGRQVADANHYNERAEENADLLAAAPALLAALIEYIAAADNSIAPENGDDIAAMLRFGEALNKARAAIARATGVAS